MTSGFIPDEIIDRVRESFDIVDFISGYLPLKRAGQNFKGLCPFHDEKSPSFSVNPARQIYHCFGCGVGGDIFNFIVRHEGVTFPEAVRELAAKAGIEIPDERRSRQSAQEGEEREQLFRVNAEAAEYFQRLLREDPRAETARVYLKKRQVDQSVVERFMLGYSLPSWDGLLKHLGSKGFTPRQVERAGLAIVKKDGHYDRFRGRLIFPIRNVGGKVIAFGGRVLEGDEQPKYLNSPETPVYIKGDNLYALNLAKEPVRKQGYALLVEGYMDAIMCHQHGIENAVATLGTALTPAQLKLLGRFGKKVAFIYDADQAGLSAMTRSLGLFIDSGIRANIVVLPQGDDPDTFLRREGAQGLTGLLKKSVRLIDYRLGEILKEGMTGSEDDRLAAVEKALQLVAKVPGGIERAELLKRIASETGVEEALLKEELHRKVRSGEPVEIRRERIKTAPAPSPRAEEMLVHLMLGDGNVRRRVLSEVGGADFSDPVLSRIVTLMADESGVESVATLIRPENGEDVNRRLTQLAAGDFGIEDTEQTVADSLRRIRNDAMKRELAKIADDMRRAETDGDLETWNSLARLQKEVQRGMKG
ncbi:MAG: DNA primase [Nitrospirota bacterium]|nr:DNA primase [Nitrospirota bacterium]